MTITPAEIQADLDYRAQIEAHARDLADLLKRHNLTFASRFGGAIMTWGEYIYAQFGDEVHAACRAMAAHLR